MKRAIISGPTGAIGTALYKQLERKGIEVLLLTRRDSPRNNQLYCNELVDVELCSLEELRSLKNDTEKQYDVFYHLAWEGTSGQGRNNSIMQEKNVEYALDAVECAKRFGCSKFIGVGSQAEYGRVNSPLTAKLECHPENEYGKAKLKAGNLTRELAHKLGMEHNWVRVLSIYGTNDSQNSLISYTIRELCNGRIPELTKGEQVWDYLYSEDAAAALLAIGEKGVDGKIYVLGSGKTNTLRGYLEALRDVVSPGAELGFGKKPYPDKQVMYLEANIDDIVNDTGWKPQIEFKEGIRKILDAEKL